MKHRLAAGRLAYPLCAARTGFADPRPATHTRSRTRATVASIPLVCARRAYLTYPSPSIGIHRPRQTGSKTGSRSWHGCGGESGGVHIPAGVGGSLAASLVAGLEQLLKGCVPYEGASADSGYLRRPSLSAARPPAASRCTVATVTVSGFVSVAVAAVPAGIIWGVFRVTRRTAVKLRDSVPYNSSSGARDAVSYRGDN